MRGNPIPGIFPADSEGLEAMDPARGTRATSIHVTGSGLDSDEVNAAIGLVTRATASIMTSNSLVSGEVGDMTGRPRLAPHAHKPIDPRHIERTRN